MTSRIFQLRILMSNAPATLILVLGIALLRIAPENPTLAWVYSTAWLAVVALAVGSILFREKPSVQNNVLVIGAVAVATILIVRFGRYECWSVLCHVMR